MKKRISLILTLLFSLSFLNAEVLFEGYDGFKWDTTVTEFQKKYPSASEITDSEDKARNERAFKRETDTITRVYRFYNNKLYWGRTIYEDPDYDTEEAIMEKIVDTYGRFDKSNEWTEDGNEYFSLWSVLTPTFSIEVTEVKYYNSYGRITGLNLFITYENEETNDEMWQYSKQQKKKNIEL